VTAGDITGDGRYEIIGTWSDGIWYWDFLASKWTQMTTYVTNRDIAAGDFNGDGKSDVASIWSDGLWYQDGANLAWTKVGTAPERLTAGDMNGKGKGSSPFKLPDTGQTQSYTDTFGEDSDYTINPLSYTDNSDGTVTDNNTGLMWQQEDDNLLYSWYEAAGIVDETHNPGGATDACGNLSLAGYSDWRLPSVKELKSIVNYNNEGLNPAIDTTYFPNTKNFSYWSSTNGIYYALQITFRGGATWDFPKEEDLYVRCVQGEPLSFNHFIDNGDGTVTNNNTGLIWQQEDDDTARIWEDAILYCENLPLAGYTDWRLPNFKELESITYYTATYNPYHKYPGIDPLYFPNTNAAGFWSSTTRYVGIGDSSAWIVSYGSYGDLSSKTASLFVRCVQGGQ
jgi:hypothetical protein